jgi:hypothetical protein
LRNKERDEEDIMTLGEEADHYLNNMDETWIYDSEESGSSFEINTDGIDDVIADREAAIEATLERAAKFVSDSRNNDDYGVYLATAIRSMK